MNKACVSMNLQLATGHAERDSKLRLMVLLSKDEFVLWACEVFDVLGRFNPQIFTGAAVNQFHGVRAFSVHYGQVHDANHKGVLANRARVGVAR